MLRFQKFCREIKKPFICTWFHLQLFQLQESLLKKAQHRNTEVNLLYRKTIKLRRGKTEQTQFMHRGRHAEISDATENTETRQKTGAGSSFKHQVHFVQLVSSLGESPDSRELGDTHPEEWSPERGWCHGCSHDWCRDCNLDSCWDGECGSGLACGRGEQQEEEVYHTGWLLGQQVRWECQCTSIGEKVGMRLGERKTEREEYWKHEASDEGPGACNSQQYKLF